MADRERPVPPFWIPEMDRKGRPIRKELYEAAARLWPRAYFQTLRELNDDSRASTIFESAVFSVSNVLHRNGHRSGIDNLDAYLYWAFSRKLAKRFTRDRLIQFVDSIELIEYRRQTGQWSFVFESDKSILLGQVLRFMDSRTRRIFLLRAGRRSWERIAEELGTNVNNATSLFNYGIKKARDRILRKTEGPIVN
jgi:hypothetical protein